MTRPRLVTGARLHYDAVRSEHVLLVPEGIVRLNPSAVAVLELCDGRHELTEIVGELSQRYAGADVGADVRGLVDAMSAKGLVVDAG
jgi:pyrroloquinoline quinone biosynthesis protein D